MLHIPCYLWWWTSWILVSHKIDGDTIAECFTIIQDADVNITPLLQKCFICPKYIYIIYYSHCLMISVHAVHHPVLPCDLILSCDPDQHVISFNKICVHKSQKSTCSTPSSSLFSLLLWYLICLFRFGTACTCLKMRWNGLLLTVLYQLFYSKGHSYTLSGLWLLVNRTVLGVCQ